MFSKEDSFAGIDLDDSLDKDGKVKPWAVGIVERFSDKYMEVSPSEQGLKIWSRGSLPANLPGVTVGDGSVELCDHARYFTVTGRVFRGAPHQIEILRALRASPEGMSRTAIRDHFSKNRSASEIDRALAVLREYGQAAFERRDTGGRPVEVWCARAR